MGTITYNKLVRDKIPQIIDEAGQSAVVETLDRDAYKRLLDAKLGEELQEYLTSDSVEELADLVEVVYAILRHRDVDIDEFEGIRLKKAAERGAFEKRLLLIEVIER